MSTDAEPGSDGAAGAAFDPFEPGYDAWPYDQYRRIREQDPVHWSELLSGWLLTRYEDVVGVLRDPTVSSELDRAAPSPVVDALRWRESARERPDGTTLVLRDDPDHARLRRLLQAPFTVRNIERLRASISARVASTLDELRPRGEMRLLADFAYPFPVAVFCEMLGIPQEAGDDFRRWTAAVAKSLDLVISEEEYAACIAEMADMETYLGEMVEEKRARPTDDILTALVQAEEEGDRLSHGELIAQLVTLYVAGHEPTTALIGNGIAHLLRYPEQLAALQADPSLIPGAVAELLRYDGPNQFVRRIAVEPMTLGGKAIRPGDVLYVGVGAANHDPAKFGPDADELRVDRADAAQHVQFGGGIHLCLGSHLAKVQAEEALTALLTTLGPLSSGGEVTWSGRMTLRSVAEVPLRFTPP